MKRFILIFSIIVLYSSMVHGQVKMKVTDSEMILPDRFNIVGTFDSELDKSLTNTEIEACGKYFKFTYSKKQKKEDSESIDREIWTKLSQVCGWED